MELRKTSYTFIYRTTAVTVLAAITSHTAMSQNPPAPIPPFSICSQNVNTLSLLPPLPGGTPNPAEDGDVQFENALIDNTELSLLRDVPTASSMDLAHQVQLLGKLFIYDKTLSPNRNIGCATCHSSRAGFTGGTSIFNATTVAQPGGVPILNATAPGPNIRYGPRKPQSYAYAAFAPILHYNATQGDFYGGNFWDMRATGMRLANPAATGSGTAGQSVRDGESRYCVRRLEGIPGRLQVAGRIDRRSSIVRYQLAFQHGLGVRDTGSTSSQ